MSHRAIPVKQKKPLVGSDDQSLESGVNLVCKHHKMNEISHSYGKFLKNNFSRNIPFAKMTKEEKIANTEFSG